jgi:hypothetical protein
MFVLHFHMLILRISIENPCFLCGVCGDYLRLLWCVVLDSTKEHLHVSVLRDNYKNALHTWESALQLKT